MARFDDRMIRLVYAVLLHLIAGVVAGSAFKVKTLILMLIFVACEMTFVLSAHDSLFSVWIIANLASVQFGYFAGILCRAAVAGVHERALRTRRLM